MVSLERFSGMASQFISNQGRRFAVIEGNINCNRRCGYCGVPQRYNRETEATIAEVCSTIDWLYDQKYRLLSLIGGEPLLEGQFVTKEGLTFFEHSLKLIQYAKRKGIVVNLTTNGDFITPQKVLALKEAGLDTLSFSLHAETQAGLFHILYGAKLAAHVGIIPTVHCVVRSDNADYIPEIAQQVAGNGILFGVGLVQEKGVFSKKPESGSLIPTGEQQQRVFQSLLRLKTFGLIRNNMNYLRNLAGGRLPNWKCNPDEDTFIHIGADRMVNVCSEVRTGLSVADIQSLDNAKWKDKKMARVRQCSGCLYHCYYESENPSPVRDIPMVGIALLIRAGKADLAKRIGQAAVDRMRHITY